MGEIFDYPIRKTKFYAESNILIWRNFNNNKQKYHINFFTQKSDFYELVISHVTDILRSANKNYTNNYTTCRFCNKPIEL